MLLVCDGDSHQLESPQWVDVEAAIENLDGTCKTEVGLFVNDNCYLQIGGGNECLVCAIRSKGKLYVLSNPERSLTSTRRVVAGQEADYPENECFPKEVIIKVAKWFWDNKTPLPDQHWNVF